MAFNENLVARIRDAVARKKNIEVKKMFGGVGFLLNGYLLMGIWNDCLCVRLGPDSYDDALLEPHVRSSTYRAGPLRAGCWSS